MANKLFVELGFSVSKDSISQVVKGLDKIGFSAIDAGFAFEKLSKKINFSSAVQTFASLNRVAADFKNSVLSIRNNVARVFDFAESYSNEGDRIAKFSSCSKRAPIRQNCIRKGLLFEEPPTQ